MNNHAFLLRRLVTAILASVAGVLATAVLWKPGVLAGAVIVPVITELVQLTFLRSAPMTPRSRTTPWFSGSHRSELRMAVGSALVGAAIVGSLFTLPPLASGKPLNDTPLFGGRVPIVESAQPDVPLDEPAETPDPGAESPTPDPDTDEDGIPDASDNCPSVANSDQADTNGKGRGDACDPDDDNDNINDKEDNCPSVANPDQADTNGKGRGDACDPDDDNDNINDDEDNCPTVANPDQANTNGTGRGDACDPDDDNDGTPDENDAFPTEVAE